MIRSSTIWAVLLSLVIIAGGWYWYSGSHAGAISGRVYKIGILVRGAGYEPGVTGFKKRMDELGYHEGTNVTYDIQFVSDQDKLASTVDKFMQEHVDLIHTYSTPATVAAIEETAKDTAHPIPVVFGSVGDPLLLPGVKSINNPGGNATGVASLSTDLTSQRLELLKEFDPTIKNVVMPRTDPSAGDAAADKSVEIAQKTAQTLGINLTLLSVNSASDNAVVASEITRSKYDGMIVGGDSLIWAGLKAYIQQDISQKIPLSVFSSSQVEDGALFGLGPDFEVCGRQSADIANKILRGGNPANIPVEVPEKLIFVVNKDTASKMGVTFSDAFLKKADVVIETKKQ